MTTPIRGRAASAAIVDRLRDAVTSGRPKTYVELAREARCTTRTIRNYLGQAERILGVRLEKARGSDGAVRVRAVADEAPAKIAELASILAREMLKNLFPIEGTELDVRKRSPVEVVVAARGAYEYNEDHLRALRAWLVAASKRPRRPVRFDYDSAASGLAPRIVWPIGIVVRDLARVYLAGLPEDALGPSEVKTYCLERIGFPQKGQAIVVLGDADAGVPPPGIDDAVIETAIDLPFSMFPARRDNQVHVHARFSADQAKHVAGRRWHKHQKLTTRRDGGLDLTFGPADRGEAAAWVRQWGPNVTLVGDAKLKAFVGSHDSRG